MNIIEFNYISPTSTYIFNNKLNNYYLIHISSHLKNSVIINKVLLPNLKNIDAEVRAMAINKAVVTSNSFEYPTQSILLFEHTVISNTLKLLFAGDLNLMELDFNKVVTVILKQPSKVLGQFRSGKYDTSDTSFLSEQFFNYETFEPDEEKCILFLTKVKKSTKDLEKSYMCNFDKLSSKFIFNRYCNNVIKEQPLIDISLLCNSNKLDDYITLIKDYNIDVNRYNSALKNKSFKSLCLRKINPNFRPLKFNPYINNLLCSPADGRISAFHINPALKFKLGLTDYTLNDIIRKPFFLNEGSGFIVRMTPADYQRVNMPYAGYLTEASILQADSVVNPYYICLKFESTYFMPSDIHEREYISVLYGNNISMSRTDPTLVDVQPKIKLIFYVILIGGVSQDSVIFTNHKLLKLKNKVKLNTTILIHDRLWLEQGEEIACFNCNTTNTVLFITNRPIDFTSDIKYYSKLLSNDDNSSNNKLEKKIECYLKSKDIVGILL